MLTRKGENCGPRSHKLPPPGAIVTVAEYQDKAQAQADNRRRVTCDACGAVVPYGETAADESGRGWLLCHTCQGVEQDLINAGGY